MDESAAQLPPIPSNPMYPCANGCELDIGGYVQAWYPDELFQGINGWVCENCRDEEVPHVENHVRLSNVLAAGSAA